jgi:hypothetical protein
VTTRFHDRGSPTTSRLAALLVGFAFVLAWEGCSDAKTTEPAITPSFVAVSQLTQQATVDHLVASNPTVRATDDAGRPVAGLIVVFNNLLAANSATVTTALDGTASTPWKLTQVAGQQTMVARLYSPKHTLLGREVTFTATAVPDTLASIRPGSALNQPGLASQPVPTPPIVFAVDEFSNPKAGVGVTFEVAGGSGSVAPATVVTDANGRAQATTWVLGDSIGVDTVVAHVPGLPPVYFTARAGPPFVATSVVTGLEHTCAIAVGGDVYCWGLNDRGQVNPHDASTFLTVPQRVPLGVGVKAVSIASGYSHTCAISNETPPQAYCWGDGLHGQLGVAGSPPVKVPVADGLASVTTGPEHSCGLTPAGVAYCWGDGTLGELGNGLMTGCLMVQGGGACSAPSPVAGNLRFVALAAGSLYTCGLTTNGQLYCWGLDAGGQLGFASESPCSEWDLQYPYGGTVPVACALTPQVVPNAPAFTSVGAGWETCGITASGSLNCLSSDGAHAVPTSLTFARVAPDGACGLASDGTAYCWNAYGLRNDPFPGGSGLKFTALTAMQQHQCAILQTTGALACWGSNDAGQLGNGTTTTSAVPSPVVTPLPPTS